MLVCMGGGGWGMCGVVVVVVVMVCVCVYVCRVLDWLFSRSVPFETLRTNGPKPLSSSVLLDV